MPARPQEAASGVRERLAQGGLPARLAALYSQHVLLRNGRAPLEGVGEAEISARLAEAVQLLEASFLADSRAERETGLRRVGEILEWLAHEALNPTGLPVSLLGAAAYQLAGYPARARSLIESRPDSESDAPLLRALLEADFHRLLRWSVGVAGSEPQTIRERLDAGEARDEAVLGHVTEVAVGQIASALGVLASSFRWPDEARVDLALEKLDQAAPALRNLVDPYAWLLVRLSAAVARDARDKSLRAALEQISAGAPEEGREALERYVRLSYLSRQALAWPSQRRGFDRLATGESFALCTPTGSGKTRVAEVALLDGLFRRDVTGGDEPLCLYIVPSRALAAEVESKLSRVLREAGGPRAVTVTSLYGGADWGATEEWLTGEQPTVLICTQEKAEALLRFFGWLLLGRLNVVIVDEAHSIQSDEDVAELQRLESRSLRLEALVASLRARRPQARFIAMSAVAQHLEQPLAEWISGEEGADPVTVRYRSTRQVVGRLHFLSSGQTRIEYDVLDGHPLRLRGALGRRPFVPRPFPAHPGGGRLRGVRQRPATFALWAAIHLASPAEDGGPPQSVLVSVAEGIGDYAMWWLELLDEIWLDEDLPTFFEQPSDDADQVLWERTLATSRDLFGEDSREYRLLKHGIVVHHGRMPGRLPALLTRLVERNIVRVVVATSVLSEGVNLPVQTVLLPGMWRWSSERPMSTREFANLAGRAGRPGVATEGQTLVLMPGSPTAMSPLRRDYNRAIAAMVAEPEALEQPQSALAELVSELRRLWSGSEADFLTWLEETAPRDVAEDENTRTLDALDAVLLGALEDPLEADAEDALRTFWRETFAHRAAGEEARLEGYFIRRGEAVADDIYPDSSQRTVLYRTSLPPREATTLLEILPGLLEHLRTGTAYGTWDDHARFTYVARTMDLVSAVPKFGVPGRVGATGAGARDVLGWWLGDPETEATPSVAQISKWHLFLQQEVRYRFTWGLGAALAVAVHDTPAEGLSAGDWRAADVPWAAVWIKDLLTWGVLDPVAAYLLATGAADTRSQAQARARPYWDTVDSQAGDPLDVSAVRAWAIEQSRPLGVRRRRRNRRVSVDVSDRFEGEALQAQYRVLPVRSDDGTTRWLDPAGFLLATSEDDDEWYRQTRRNDFVLHPSEGVVLVQQYV